MDQREVREYIRSNHHFNPKNNPTVMNKGQWWCNGKKMHPLMIGTTKQNSIDIPSPPIQAHSAMSQSPIPQSPIAQSPISGSPGSAGFTFMRQRTLSTDETIFT